MFLVILYCKHFIDPRLGNLYVIWEQSETPQGFWIYSVQPSPLLDPLTLTSAHVHKNLYAHVGDAQSVFHSGHGECHWSADRSLEKTSNAHKHADTFSRFITHSNDDPLIIESYLLQAQTQA